MPMTQERARELASQLSLSKHLPIIFGNGNRVTCLSTNCLGCEAEIHSASINGELRWLLPHVVQVEAVGYCRHCNLLTPLGYRIDDQLAILTLQHGRWQRFESRPASLLARCRRWLRGMASAPRPR